MVESGILTAIGKPLIFYYLFWNVIRAYLSLFCGRSTF